ncbi:MAG: DUF3536 domain-containing protein [Parachlamydiales bacterium]|nr:DUF3536 domain-containing protein [Parachlamydiales bacterium]
MKDENLINKFICIHGHFYQPPRENPWLEGIELQESAKPYHDWNERITSECYGPNCAARLVNNNNNIINIINNYRNISYNFGPTLLSWMEKNEKDIYEEIIKSDKKNDQNPLTENSAIAQCYNHIIMPLANEKDKETQILWGIKDFEYRFKRKPKGMWLPETAVDLKTLDIMQKNGILFTILSPFQAFRVRKKNQTNWIEKYSAIDTKIPYLLKLPSNNSIVVFFYDGALSNDMAFKNILSNGETFFKRIYSAFPNNAKQPQLINVATDGETYGHHKKFADMALAYCIERIKKDPSVSLITYDHFLSKCTLQYEVEIIENSSWSCAHKVGRWSEDCGCNLENRPNWNQKWRKYLRQAMDFLRDRLYEIYEKNILKYVEDPVLTRNNYIDIILDRSKENIDKFTLQHTKKTLNENETIEFLKLLEMQRFAMSIFTSCGWFFDDLKRIETLQILTYAARAIQLAKEVSNVDLEEDYKKILELAKSNEGENGREIYDQLIKPKILDLKKIAVLFAISSLFEKYEKNTTFYCFDIETEDHNVIYSKTKNLSFGKATITSKITKEKIFIYFAALHFEDQNLVVGISENKNIDFEYLKKIFFSENISQTKKIIFDYFEIHDFSFWDLLIDDQLRILDKILNDSINNIGHSIEKGYDIHYALIQKIHEKRMHLSSLLLKSIEVMLNDKLINQLKNYDQNFTKIQKIVHEITKWEFDIDKENVTYLLKKIIEKLSHDFKNNIFQVEILKMLNDLFELFSPFSLQIPLWNLQNIYFSIFKKHFKTFQEKSFENDPFAKNWINGFNELQKYLGFDLFC